MPESHAERIPLPQKRSGTTSRMSVSKSHLKVISRPLRRLKRCGARSAGAATKPTYRTKVSAFCHGDDLCVDVAKESRELLE